MAIHVQTHIHTHTCIPHTCTRSGERERDSRLILWCFLGLNFNQTTTLLLLFLLSNYQHWLDTDKGPSEKVAPEPPENKLSHQGLSGQGPPPRSHGGVVRRSVHVVLDLPPGEMGLHQVHVSGARLSPGLGWQEQRVFLRFTSAALCTKQKES